MHVGTRQVQGGKGKQNEPACAGGRTGQLRAAEGMREGQDKCMQNRAARWDRLMKTNKAVQGKRFVSAPGRGNRTPFYLLVL